LHITTTTTILILNHKTIPKVQLLGRIIVKYQPKCWMSNEVLKDWLALALNRRLRVILRKQGLLVLDAFKSVTTEIQATITSSSTNTDLVIIT
jgi:hypothetical protein